MYTETAITVHAFKQRISEIHRQSVGRNFTDAELNELHALVVAITKIESRQSGV